MGSVRGGGEERVGSNLLDCLFDVDKLRSQISPIHQIAPLRLNDTKEFFCPFIFTADNLLKGVLQ